MKMNLRSRLLLRAALGWFWLRRYFGGRLWRESFCPVREIGRFGRFEAAGFLIAMMLHLRCINSVPIDKETREKKC